MTDQNFRKGNYLLQTQSGKFVFIRANSLGITISVPGGTIPQDELVRITKEILQDEYRPTKPGDFNYLWNENKQRIMPTCELLARQDWYTLISEKTIISDRTDKGGRVEIGGTDCGSLSMETLSPDGKRITYHLSKFEDSPTVCTGDDLSWSTNDPIHSIRAYPAVQNEKEFERLVPYFWRIIQKIIGDDKIVIISRYMGGEESTEEIDQKNKLKKVTDAEYYTFENGQPRLSDYKGDGYQEYFFEAEPNRMVLIRTAGHSSFPTYLYYETKTYKKGITVEEIIRKIQKEK